MTTPLRIRTPAERRLVTHLEKILGGLDASMPRLLDVGAGASLVIEEELVRSGFRFVCDRVDAETCDVQHPVVGSCHRCSVEAMSPVDAGLYDAVFANYVLEHVRSTLSAARELYRVLRPGGFFVASVPDPSAPEFIVSRLTPLAFHRRVRGDESFETHYDFKNLPALVRLFESVGFVTLEIWKAPFIQQYLRRFPPLGAAGRLYDAAVGWLGWSRLMGNACVLFQKPDHE